MLERTVSVAAVVLATLWTGATAVGAQSASYVGPDFVASVRRNNSGEQSVSFRIDPTGTVTASNVTMRHLMWHAFEIADFQIVDAPAWTNIERYDVTLKSDGAAPPEKIRERLKELLHGVFGLRVVAATRPAPIYALVTNLEGRPGPQLKAAQPPCDKDGSSGCGARVGTGTLEARGITLDRLAGELGGALERRVENRTGLEGRYEIRLEWAPSLDADIRPSIFTAVEEQLGLRLVPATADLPAFIVQQVNRPSD